MFKPYASNTSFRFISFNSVDKTKIATEYRIAFACFPHSGNKNTVQCHSRLFVHSECACVFAISISIYILFILFCGMNDENILHCASLNGFRVDFFIHYICLRLPFCFLSFFLIFVLLNSVSAIHIKKNHVNYFKDSFFFFTILYHY